MDKEQAASFMESVAQLINKYFGGSAEDKQQVEITKALNEEQRMALFVVLEPDVIDLHGDTYNAVEIEKACHNFNTHCRAANIFHAVETQNAEIVQSYIAPVDFQLDNGRTVQKGTWLQWWQFPEGNEVSDQLWEGVKDGTINGVSIGAKAIVEELSDES